MARGDGEPPRKKARASTPSPAPTASSTASTSSTPTETHGVSPGPTVPSPFQLTTIRDVPAALNRDTVTLQSLICDPMVAELWEFNYMHDLDFLMRNLDPDTRHLVRIHVVHGSWKADSGLLMKVYRCLYLFSHAPILTSPEPSAALPQYQAPLRLHARDVWHAYALAFVARLVADTVQTIPR